MKKFLLIFLILGVHITYAATFDEVINGIRYMLDSSTKTCEVSRPRSMGNRYSGEINIPETVTYGSDVYSVTSIG